jgi:hypothetical protein
MVTAAIALTVCPLSLSLLLLSPRQLVFSFSKYVDWGAHFGGTIQGILSGVLVLTRELDNVYSKVLPSLLLSSHSCAIASGASASCPWSSSESPSAGLCTRCSTTCTPPEITSISTTRTTTGATPELSRNPAPFPVNTSPPSLRQTISS